MNGHAGSAVPAQAGPSKLKSGGNINGNSVVNGSSAGNGSMNSNESAPSPPPSHASTVHVSVGNGTSHTGPLSGASPYFQPAAVNLNYNSPQSAQMMGGYAYYHPQQQQQQQQHQAYAGYPPAGGSYAMRTPPNGSSNGVNGNAGYSRQNNYHQQQQQQQQQQGHFHQQQHQHMPSYDYNAHMHHSAGNAAGPSRYQGYSPYNPYYPQPVYAQQGPAMQASPYPVYQPSGGAYPGAQPMYYDPSMYYQPPTSSGRPPYNYMHQGANGPYPYAMPTSDMSHPMSTPLQPQTPSSSHVSPYPTSQLPQATISNPPLPPPRESDQPPQPPPPILSDETLTSESKSKAEGSDSMPVFASVMRSAVTIKRDETVVPSPKQEKKEEGKKEEQKVETPQADASRDSQSKGESVDAGSGGARMEESTATSPEPPKDSSIPARTESDETTVPEKEVDVIEDGFKVDADQTYLYGRGRPVDQAEAPAILFSSKLSQGSPESDKWTAWSGRVEAVTKGDQLAAAERRHQTRVLAFARNGDRSSSAEPEMQFGEVDASMIAESTRSIRERAKQAKSAAETAARENAKNIEVETITEEPARPAEGVSPTVEQSFTPKPEVSTPSSPAPPPVKTAPKSWAALLRPSASASAKTPADAARSIPSGSSNVDEPSAEVQVDGEPIGKAGVSAEGAKPSKPTGYAAAAAAGSAAWGAAGRSGELDLGKLLSEGVGGLPLSAGAAGLASVPRGLINTGNMCFANSIMQVLAYCNPFNILLQELSKRIQADLGGRTRLLEAMMLFLREFAAAEMGDSEANESGIASDKAIPASARPEKVSSVGIAKSGEAFVPTYVYEAMRENKRFDTMRRGHQEDAEEFMGFFLETLHEELLYLVSRHESRTAKGPQKDVTTVPNKASDDSSEEREVTRPVSPSAGRDDGWLEVGKGQKLNVVRTTTSRESAISRIFGGKLRSVLRTPGQKDSVTLEPYQPLQLDISAPNVHTITEALLHLNEPETISGVYSASRGTNVDATKTVYLETVPPILTLHLKRFLYDPVENRVVKKGKAVAYGPELIIPSSIISPARRPAGSELRYRLFGVVYHHGSTATGGHYTACVLKQDGKGWLHLDDELVENVEGDAGVYVTRDAAVHGDAGTVGRSMRSKCAYLLFYARI